MSVESPETSQDNVEPVPPAKPGAAPPNAQPEGKKKSRPMTPAEKAAAAMTPEEREAENARLHDAYDKAMSGNPLAKWLSGFVGGFGSDKDDNSPIQDAGTVTLDKFMDNLLRVAVSPSEADRTKYQYQDKDGQYKTLKQFDGDPATVQENVRIVMTKMIADSTIKLKPEQEKAILDHIPAMVAAGHVKDMHFDRAKMKADMIGFMKDHGGVDLNIHVESNMPAMQARVEADHLAYGKPISGKEFKDAFNGHITLQHRDGAGDLSVMDTKNKADVLKMLGDDFVVQSVSQKDTAIDTLGGDKIEAGKRPETYPDNYFAFNKTTGQGFYISSDSVNLQKAFPGADPNKRDGLVNDFLKPVEPQRTITPQDQQPNAQLQQTTAMNFNDPKFTNTYGPG